MPSFWTNIGEEAYTELSLNAITLKVGLYLDSTDGLGDASDLSDITTEPQGASYDRQSVSVTTRQIQGDFGFDNDSDVVFDVSDSSVDVDHAFYVVNFQSDGVAGDGSPTDHLVAVAPLTQLRQLGGLRQLKFPAGQLRAVAD